jgi:hypothetical protein
MFFVETILCPLSGDARIQGKEEKGTDIDSLQKNISIKIACITAKETNKNK